MKKWRGQRGQQSSGLPRLHARALNGKALCGARSRKLGTLFAQRHEETDCERCKAKLPPEATSEEQSREGYRLGYMQGRSAS